jgi:hypothetical protein
MTLRSRCGQVSEDGEAARLMMEDGDGHFDADRGGDAPARGGGGGSSDGAQPATTGGPGTGDEGREAEEEEEEEEERSEPGGQDTDGGGGVGGAGDLEDNGRAGRWLGSPGLPSPGRRPLSPGRRPVSPSRRPMSPGPRRGSPDEQRRRLSPEGAVPMRIAGGLGGGSWSGPKFGGSGSGQRFGGSWSERQRAGSGTGADSGATPVTGGLTAENLALHVQQVWSAGQADALTVGQGDGPW